MKKYILGIFLMMISGLIFWACEEDDICTENKTPELIIKLKNTANPGETMDSLYVLRQDAKDEFTLIAGGAGRDSISVPLPLKPTTETNLIFSRRKTTDQFLDVLKIKYKYSTEYVSKACGFKAVYSDLSATSSSHKFIKSIEILQHEVTDQSAAHILLTY
ncbi:hypothetical protein EDL99_06040 [Ornithobacterium rhinotracheale]|uniref:DUF6452 family protein n=1 Tax=Ornithobacterium rhinotracheale TaxID=28251 RepID=UPI00129CD0EA|nr:DUF6452 family protein [Ornithobacterium rhinotracheale]MRJ08432.1 hypothetical protein [Ornithobacterium rhinotracheale]UOH77626.1 DUF6452 family protein [Ornithobacterium rhinotracheale]